MIGDQVGNVGIVQKDGAIELGYVQNVFFGHFVGLGNSKERN